MAVRRLAPEAVQPATFAFSADNESWAALQIAKYPEGRQASAIIPLLWQAQKQAGGWLPRAAIEHVADRLRMPRIRALEVATFYTMFNLEPVGRHFVQLCGTTPCALRGAEKLKAVCRDRIGAERKVTADGLFSWVEVECLGACCNAPMVQINDNFYEDLTPESFGKLLDDMAAGRPVKVGPQNGRRASEPEGSVTTLLDQTLYDGSRLGGWRSRFAEKPEAAAAPVPAASQPAAAAPAASAPAAAPANPPPATEPAKPAPAAAQSATPAAAVAPAAPAAARSAAAAAPAAATAAPAVPAAKPDDAELAAEAKDMEARLAALPKSASATDKANAVGTRPVGLAAPRGGSADDLKRIKGIGRVNEGKLNGLGIFHFSQIADWTRPEVRWVGTFLAFPGRIDREDWLSQARALASGAETEFSKRVDRGEVPTSSSGQKA
jgi:NADH-quinone oxidoreductase subunit E